MNNDNPKAIDAEGKGVRLLFSSYVQWTDFILACVIIALCGILYAVTYSFDQIPVSLSQNLPPEWFPRLLLWIIVILTVIIPFEHLFHARGKKHLDEDRSARIKPISIYTAALLCGIIALMPWLGTVFTMVLVCAMLPVLWGEKRLTFILPFAIIFPGLVTLLFTKMLGVYFEPGLWEKLF